METLLANLSSKVRRETLHGRSYLVAPVSMIAEGVLPGSQGPILYLNEDQRASVDGWNGMPIVVYHPVNEDGKPISARQPKVIREQGVGTVYETAHNGRLAAEAWVDEALALAYDQKLAKEHRIVPRLLRGEPIEVSTGLYIDHEPAPAGATHNGTPYTHVARNYRPDHLAILPDQTGACSVKDGCGVLVNEESTAVRALKKVRRFLANAFCPTGRGGGKNNSCSSKGSAGRNRAAERSHAAWKAHGEAVAGKRGLTAAARLHLRAAKAARKAGNKNLAREHRAAAKDLRSRVPTARLLSNGKKKRTDRAALVANTSTTGDTPMPLTPEQRALLLAPLVVNCACAETKAKLEALPDDDLMKEVAKKATPEKKEAAVTANAAKTEAVVVAKPPTLQEWLTQAPAEVRSVVANAVQVAEREKAQLIDRLTANLAADKKPARVEKLKALSLDELRDRLEDLPVVNTDPILNYFGAAGAPAQNAKDDSDNILPIFSHDFAAEKTA